MDYKPFEQEISFLEEELETLREKLLTGRNNDTEYLKTMRVYLAVSNQILAIKMKMSKLRKEERKEEETDPLLDFNE